MARPCKSVRIVDGKSEKHCPKCDQWKSLDQDHFYLRRINQNGVSMQKREFYPLCIACSREQKNKWRKAHLKIASERVRKSKQYKILQRWKSYELYKIIQENLTVIHPELCDDRLVRIVADSLKLIKLHLLSEEPGISLSVKNAKFKYPKSAFPNVTKLYSS